MTFNDFGKAIAWSMGKPLPKKTRFTATQNGQRFTWKFWYDSTARLWFLEDYEGYVRTLESTWVDSVPRIRTVLANHDMVAEIS